MYKAQRRLLCDVFVNYCLVSSFPPFGQPRGIKKSKYKGLIRLAKTYIEILVTMTALRGNRERDGGLVGF